MTEPRLLPIPWPVVSIPPGATCVVKSYPTTAAVKAWKLVLPTQLAGMVALGGAKIDDKDVPLGMTSGDIHIEMLKPSGTLGHTLDLDWPNMNIGQTASLVVVNQSSASVDFRCVLMVEPLEPVESLDIDEWKKRREKGLKAMRVRAGREGILKIFDTILGGLSAEIDTYEALLDNANKRMDKCEADLSELTKHVAAVAGKLMVPLVVKRSEMSCCEAMRRLDAIEGDATTLVGWACPIHGIGLRTIEGGVVEQMREILKDAANRLVGCAERAGELAAALERRAEFDKVAPIRAEAETAKIVAEYVRAMGSKIPEIE